MYTKIAADKYTIMKKRHDESMQSLGMTMPFDAVPVDMNGGYVAFDTSQSAKEGNDNLDKSSRCNLERFGLTEDGVL